MKMTFAAGRASALLKVLAGAVVLTFGAQSLTSAQAQESFPERPITMIVPYAAGGTTDILARLMSDEMSKTLGQPVVVEYRPGAGGTLGSELASEAAPDGYTIVMGAPGSHATSPSLYKDLAYDPVEDFETISRVALVPNVVIVHPSVEAETLEELIALMKEKPGQINYGSAGVGATTHLTGELFGQMAGVDIMHIPYKGSGDAMIDLVSGQIQMMFENLPGAMGQIEGGQVRPLAVTSSERSPALPDIPTVAEAGVPGFEVVSWFGLFAPAGTPEPIISKLNEAVQTALENPEVRERLLELGAIPAGGTPQEFHDFVVSERDKWAEVIKSAGIEPR